MQTPILLCDSLIHSPVSLTFYHHDHVKTDLHERKPREPEQVTKQNSAYIADAGYLCICICTFTTNVINYNSFYKRSKRKGINFKVKSVVL